LTVPLLNPSACEEILMSRRSSKWIALACLSLAALTSACDRVDTTGPSDVAPAFEAQGANN
jgi:hypothetical protein